MADPLPPLVSPEWLAAHREEPGLRIVDATWLLPDDPRDPLADYLAGHIPGAIFLPLSALSDPADPRPMMLASDARAAEQLGALGIGHDDRIIIYDNSPVKSAARAWWALQPIYGAAQVAILDGGLAQWQAEGRPLQTGAVALPAARFTITGNRERVRSKADMLANLDTAQTQVADARGPARFAGSEPEPRPGMAAGHIPGSINLPYTVLFNADGRWKDPAGLRAAFEAAGITLDRPFITSCGSGVTASVLAFAAHLIGKTDVALYDGSWSEWGLDPDTPKAVG